MTIGTTTLGTTMDCFKKGFKSATVAVPWKKRYIAFVVVPFVIFLTFFFIFYNGMFFAVPNFRSRDTYYKNIQDVNEVIFVSDNATVISQITPFHKCVYVKKWNTWYEVRKISSATLKPVCNERIVDVCIERDYVSITVKDQTNQTIYQGKFVEY